MSAGSRHVQVAYHEIRKRLPDKFQSGFSVVRLQDPVRRFQAPFKQIGGFRVIIYDKDAMGDGRVWSGNLVCRGIIPEQSVFIFDDGRGFLGSESERNREAE